MEIKFIGCGDAEFSLVKSIRDEVFIKEQGALKNEEYDEYDSSEKTVYALIFDGDGAVATGRIVFFNNCCKIGRIAVLKSQRGKGLGAVLVKALCSKAEQTGAEKIFVDSQIYAIPFYEKLGFALISDETVFDRGLPHKRMMKG